MQGWQRGPIRLALALSASALVFVGAAPHLPGHRVTASLTAQHLGMADANPDAASPVVPVAPPVSPPSPTPAARPSRGATGPIASDVGWTATQARVVTTLTDSGIPLIALRAYRNAEADLRHVDPTCHLSWSLLAAIGRVESNHGRFAGSELLSDGRSTPPVIGIALDGRPGVALVRDTDHGRYDHDRVYDRAVGAMQFLPGTWRHVGVDGDGDGVADPQDINDAAPAAGAYLCAGGRNLSTLPGLRAAVFSYNHSASYVDMVLALKSAYEQGLPVTELPTATATKVEPTVPKHSLPPATTGPPPGVSPAAAGASAAPSPAVSPSLSPTPSPSASPSTSPTVSPSPHKHRRNHKGKNQGNATPSASPSPDATPSPSPSGSPSPGATIAPSPSGKPTPSASPSPSPSCSATPSPSASASPSPSTSPSPSPSTSPSASPTPTPTPSTGPSASPTPSPSPSTGPPASPAPCPSP